jgi:hypothetical protein
VEVIAHHQARVGDVVQAQCFAVHSRRKLVDDDAVLDTQGLTSPLPARKLCAVKRAGSCCEWTVALRSAQPEAGMVRLVESIPPITLGKVSSIHQSVPSMCKTVQTMCSRLRLQLTQFGVVARARGMLLLCISTSACLRAPTSYDDLQHEVHFVSAKHTGLQSGRTLSVGNQFRRRLREKARAAAESSTTRTTVSTSAARSNGLGRKPTKAAFLLRSLAPTWASASSAA